MKVLPLAALLVVICQGASAQTSECSTVPKASDRLACYDRATPPTPAKSARPKSPPSPDKATIPPDQKQLVDKLAIENSRLDARLKTICRGC
jgi:hypothetical protein